MIIPVEILCLWEKYYKRGDYVKICSILALNNVTISPKQLVNYIHSGNMPDDVYKVFEKFYIEREK